MNKLPKQFKTKWVKALRSNLNQDSGTLYSSDGNSYCCLGVACKVAGVSKDRYEGHGYITECIKNYQKVPVLLHDEGEIPRGLAFLNDNEVPFEVIAGFIQENL